MGHLESGDTSADIALQVFLLPLFWLCCKATFTADMTCQIQYICIVQKKAVRLIFKSVSEILLC